MRIVTPEEAVAGIRSGQQVFVHGGAASPSVLIAALAARSAELRDVGVVHFHAEGPAPHLAPEMAASFRHRALFIGASARAAVNEGRADYVPIFLSDVPQLFATGVLPLNVALINVSAPDGQATARWAPASTPRWPRRAPRRRSSPSSTPRCRARWVTRSSMLTRSTWRSRSTSRPMSTVRRPSARWSAASASSWRSSFRTRRRSRWGSAPSRPR